MRARAALAAVLCLAGLAAPAEAAIPRFEPPFHADGARDSPGGPLDLRAVAFGQRETRMVLHVRTRQAFATSSLRDGRTLCLVLAPREDRLCVVPGERRGGYVLHTPPGGEPRVIRAAVSRPTTRSVRASFAAREAGLGMGRVGWAVESRGGRAADRAPNSGQRSATVGVLGHPACFAAAARDPRRRCTNTSLRRMAYPRPAAAYIWPNAPCRRLRPPGQPVFDPCEFGVTGGGHAGTIALVGDSHAVHWRSALEVVAQARRWRGVSITRAGCPFSVRVPSSPTLGPAGCHQQHRETIAWLRANPEVDTLFVSSWAQPGSGPQGGLGGYGGGAAAFGAMLDQVPPSVRRIYVLRDIPRTTRRAITCVQSRRHRELPLVNRCATPRAAALIGDPAAAAAARRPRVRAVDLTRHFCSALRCFPVVGGAYVYKDDNHMNAVFSTSLGPFVLRALSA